jgi:hypothetical protein
MLIGILGDVKVLAVNAVKVATHGANGVGGGSGQKIEQRFLLYGIDFFGNDSAINQTVKFSISVFPHATDTPFALPDLAPVITETAAHLIFGDWLVK